MPTVWPATQVRSAEAMEPTDRPRSAAASRRTVMSITGLSGLRLLSRSTSPGMPRRRSITTRFRRSSSPRSGPCSENSTCFCPPTGSRWPTWVTVMPGTLCSCSRSTPDSSSPLRWRKWRSSRRM